MMKLHRLKTYEVCLISLLIKTMQIKNKILFTFQNGKDKKLFGKTRH